ncbi:MULTISPECIES: ABC-2 family transporter protein [Enterococcus]|uniref:ABC-2 family transporter protein n=1 Tax=Enterococcus TaxID=1350 RepID=UPI0026ED756C|nr:ABC-2 family transporter protein [Enterococcus sp. S86.2]
MSTIIEIFTKYVKIIKRYMRLSYLNYFQTKIDWFSNFFMLFFDLFSIGLFWYSLTELGFQISNWGNSQLLTFIGLVLCSDGIAKCLFGFRDFEFLLLNGKFDCYLVRPVPILVSILLEKLNVFVIFGKLLIGILLVLYTSLSRSFNSPFIATFCLIFGSITLEMLYGSFTLLSFWFGKIYAAREMFFSFRQAKSYPMQVFPHLVREIFTYVLPLSFMATIPVNILYGEEVAGLRLLAIIFCLCVGSVILFTLLLRQGLKKYSSVGS